MADTDTNENFAKEVSEFLQESCRPLPVCFFNVTGDFHVHSCPTDHPVDAVRCRVIPVVTGSSAEFHIDPMLKCVGDIDVMYHYSSELAIPEGHQPPTELPKDFDNRVKVFEIVDSHVPGYIYLHLTYVLSKRMTDGKYVIQHYVNATNTILSHEFYVTAGVSKDAEIHGPSARNSIRIISPNNIKLLKLSDLPIDTVPCVRCLVWPTQADDWPTRCRKYSWPDMGTVDQVVSNGCDVVGVACSLCAPDEWMSKHQWRLSFSRAEIALLNSWTPTQQIIYHMLRIFMKTEGLTTSNKENTQKSTFSNYHIKTMMLWACELKPLHWWADGSNIVRLFARCLYFLEEWITKERGQHYFISNVHFTDYIDTFSIDTVRAVMKSTTEDCLAEWFVDNYMRKCAEECPANLPILCHDMVTNAIVHDTASAILKWKQYTVANAWMGNFFSLFIKEMALPSLRSWETEPMNLMISFARHGVTSVLSSFMHRTPQLDINAFTMYWDSFATSYLNAITNVGEFPFKNGFVDWIAMMCRFGRRLHSTSSPSKAVLWMKIVADKHPKNHQIVHINLAKEYLLREMTCGDSDSQSMSMYHRANVYMAVLCYITGQYQKATDHCTLVTRSGSHLQRSSRVVDGDILPKIDDNVDNVLGLAVFYQYLRTNLVKQLQQTHHASVFTTELFAHYFNIRHLLVVKCLAAKDQEKRMMHEVRFYLYQELKHFFNRIASAPRLFVTDLLLLKFSNNSTLCRLRSVKLTNCDSWNRQTLLQWLIEMPIEQMFSRYQQLILPRDVRSQYFAAVKTSDFMPLRLYRCKLYERCVQLCQRAVYETIDGHVRPTARLCFLYREFVQLMDDDVVSLIGMAVLVDKSIRQSELKETISVSELTMCLYLLTRCQIHIQSAKWKPDLSPLTDILDLIAGAEKLIPSHKALDHLVLKLAERLSVMYITNLLNFSDRRRTDRRRRRHELFDTRDTHPIDLELFH